ncbi:MAG: hypothetical protein R3Y50_09435 [Rikenellaceae bacterium]
MIVMLNLMRSNPYSANGKFQLERALVQSDESTLKRGMLVGYNDVLSVVSTTYKRALEIYSPLNSKMINYYDFEIIESDKSKECTIIHFKSKDKYFDTKCKISGEGYLYYCNENRFIKKIVMENYIDKFSNLPRKRYITPTSPLATNHRIEINYEIKSGTIFPVDISMNVEWQDPMVDDEFYLSNLIADHDLLVRS